MLISAGVLAAVITTPTTAQSTRAEQATWLARLDQADRAPLRRLLGHAPPTFSDDLRWHNVESPLSWQALRDKVVVIQSWTSANDKGREAIKNVQEAVSGFSEMDVQLILLHTPEGAEEAANYLKSEKIKAATVIDPVGEFCDAMGVYREPVNLLIDRHGAVRNAGLTPSGVTAAINAIIDETYDSNRCPGQGSAVGGEKMFPTFSNSVGNARDVRGTHAPALQAQEWLNGQPDTNGKVVVLAFWATWCGPCVQTIPRLNQVAERFENDVAVIGLSSEGKAQIEQGMTRRNLTLDRFKYTIGYDSEARMSGAVAVRGIPHSIVMCSDWIVRWQGHPAGLSDAVLQQIVDANNADAPQPVGRWMASR